MVAVVVVVNVVVVAIVVVVVAIIVVVVAISVIVFWVSFLLLLLMLLLCFVCCYAVFSKQEGGNTINQKRGCQKAEECLGKIKGGIMFLNVKIMVFLLFVFVCTRVSSKAL